MNRSWTLGLLFAFSLGCSSSSSPAASAAGQGGAAGAAGTGGAGGMGAGGAMSGSCPQNGVIPSDLRDVERAGEGLVTTTFGDIKGMHAPDWKRAASVLSILKGVWGKTKAACPNLPASNVAATDQAIVDIDAAITAKDQNKAVAASNAVGLAVPELFDYFHPSAPLEIVRMDAVYRQVGIDAFAGKLDAAAKDIQSVKTDWNNSRKAVADKVPACHRVGNTANIAMDIDTSLANLDAAVTKGDAMTMLVESENGALEIDTLELLFDCPPDNVPPTGKSVGAACMDASSCDPGLVCDTTTLGGKCAPDPATAKIGTACTTTVDCGSNDRSACLTEAGDAYPGGYCGMEPCDDVQVCPTGATCVAIGGERPGCYQSCKVDSDCRASEGYVCQLFVTLPPNGFGPSDHGCAFACKDDSQCQAPLKCDAGSGKCTP